MCNTSIKFPGRPRAEKSRSSQSFSSTWRELLSGAKRPARNDKHYSANVFRIGPKFKAQSFKTTTQDAKQATCARKMQALRCGLWRLLVLVAAVQSVAALRFSSVQMPTLVQRGANFWLACVHEQAPDEQLYSVKWYKNNEEFYRLLAGEQQRHFSVAGVNVMMSQSNATHVRLLNASLESEGSYACEISTQNLSTVRHEREIRVYVAPGNNNARLQIAGLKSRYALNERVELRCSTSEPARPAGAIAWFINGERAASASSIGRLAAARAETSAPAQSGGNKLNEAQRLHSVLRFTLSAELLEAAAEVAPGAGSGRAHNQSAARQQQRRARPAPLLSVECKYKQTEVSELTFSELVVPASQWRAPPTAGDAPRPGPGWSWRNETRGELVYRGAKNQILARAERQAADAPPSGACELGALALDQDDPVVAWATSGERAPAERRARDARQQRATLRAGCLTLGALAASERAGRVHAPAYCADSEQLRRSLVSAKQQPGEWTRARQRPHLSAQLALADDELAAARRRQPPASSWASGAGAEQLRAVAEHATIGAAPPLLEWFINNQEAPDSSARYWPALPLSVPPGVERAQQQQQRSPLGAHAADGAQAAPLERLPAIDYQEYFANFAQRPLRQQLELELGLHEGHFETADSALTLRCSSTKAQVLASDSIVVDFYAAHEADKQRAWQKRPPASKYFSHSSPALAHGRPTLGQQQDARQQPPLNQQRAGSTASRVGPHLALVQACSMAALLRASRLAFLSS